MKICRDQKKQQTKNDSDPGRQGRYRQKRDQQYSSKSGSDVTQLDKFQRRSDSINFNLNDSISGSASNTSFVL
jgi:hypothetical protein